MQNTPMRDKATDENIYIYIDISVCQYIHISHYILVNCSFNFYTSKVIGKRRKRPGHTLLSNLKMIPLIKWNPIIYTSHPQYYN